MCNLRHEQRGPSVLVSTLARPQVQPRALALPQEQVAFAAHTHELSPLRPQQVLGVTIVNVERGERERIERD